MNEFRRQWEAFIIWSAVSALVLRFIAELPWSLIGVFVLGLFVARELARDAVQRWSERYISPGIDGDYSIVNPRVWTFELSLSKAFIQEVADNLSNRLSTHKIKDSMPLGGWSTPDYAWRETLEKLVIEEYPHKVRVHRWLVTGEQEDSCTSLYKWFDLEATGLTLQFEKHGGCVLWAYDTDTRGGALSLSGSWERDATKKRVYFQLTLWVDHWSYRVQTGMEQIPPSDVIFQIPLDPGRLCDERGQLVYVRGEGGREFKAGEMRPFPYDEEKWNGKSGEGSEFRWEWFLHMKTVPFQ